MAFDWGPTHVARDLSVQKESRRRRKGHDLALDHVTGNAGEQRPASSLDHTNALDSDHPVAAV